jgi:hypothetical protein
MSINSSKIDQVEIELLSLCDRLGEHSNNCSYLHQDVQDSSILSALRDQNTALMNECRAAIKNYNSFSYTPNTQHIMSKLHEIKAHLTELDMLEEFVFKLNPGLNPKGRSSYTY